ncbi:MAG: ExbD/TolR family protein [Alphaproteobacteria bacterium]|nr:ExbD/TolR family protein [Alphaproteobacteria bacterium]|tara:strand:- start:56 stop:499 length:444 start_codon:yes stop_codon:yes gene_type:complete
MARRYIRSNLRRPYRGPVTDINVAPFVDVMLVLVIIFMVAAPLLNIGVPVDLPKATLKPLNESQEPLIITINSAGKTYIQEAEVGENALIPRLKALTNANPDLRIFVRGDRSINYGRIIEVMGMISSAGFTKVALVAEAPLPGDKKK